MNAKQLGKLIKRRRKELGVRQEDFARLITEDLSRAGSSRRLSGETLSLIERGQQNGADVLLRVMERVGLTVAISAEPPTHNETEETR